MKKKTANSNFSKSFEHNLSFLREINEEEDISIRDMKEDINYQLAVNGFIRNQAIVTRTDFTKPVITLGSQTKAQYTNIRDVKDERVFSTMMQKK